MRMARKLGLHNASNLIVLREGTWSYVYSGQARDWATAIDSVAGESYAAVSPFIDDSGAHTFRNSGRYNEVVVANTGVAIDLTPFSSIRVKYSKWVNTERNIRASIELQPATSTSYLPYSIAGGYRPQMMNDLIITHDDDNNPGEIVLHIPESAKTIARKIWIKVPKNYYYGDANVVIDRITLEK